MSEVTTCSLIPVAFVTVAITALMAFAAVQTIAVIEEKHSWILHKYVKLAPAVVVPLLTLFLIGGVVANSPGMKIVPCHRGETAQMARLSVIAKLVPCQCGCGCDK